MIELQELFNESAQADVHKCYERFGLLLHRVVDECTLDSGMQFSGLFAQLEYLLTERLSADEPTVRRVHDLRVRVRRYKEFSEEYLQHHCLYDLRTLCELVNLLTGEEIPASLVALFPRGSYRLAGARHAETDCMRVVVESVDDSFVYARLDDEGANKVVVCYDTTNSDILGETAKFAFGDWRCLRPLLQPCVRLNLVRPRRVEHKEGKTAQTFFVPELIIYEPDYLVDVSAVAGLFESYAHSPLLHLLGKFKPAPESEAIVLGNLASQLLDEELLFEGKEKDYASSVRDFFRYNALAVATLQQLPASFHLEAQNQRRNIQRAIRKGLSEMTSFDREKAVVEPSFFCEMLGLQGRMDMLQTDYTVLVEQKSGKSEFPVNPDNIRAQEKHFVQLLLYQAVLHYQMHLRNDEIHPFLLYSKYEKGLIRTGVAPAKLFEALCLRNVLVHQELLLSTDVGAQMITNLKVEDFLQLRVSDRLWRGYIEPQLQQLIFPLQQASPLERAYFLRMLRFVQTEHIMAKLGNRSKECSGFASAWNSNLAEKRLAGNIFDRLSIRELVWEDNAIVGVELNAEEDDSEFLANFRRGDIVVLYPYRRGSEPDMRQTMVMRASIVDVGDGCLTLHLRAPQTHRVVFDYDEDWCWAVEHDFMESSFTSLYRALHSFLTSPLHRRQLILGLRKPETDSARTLVGDYGKFNDMVLAAKQAKDFFLVIGPPGTGKTSFGMLNILREQLREPQTNILLAAYTNRAVDEICSKLVEQGIDFIRIGGALNCAADYRRYLLGVQMDSCKNVNDLRWLLDRQRVFVGTTTSFASHQQLFRLKHFDLAIIDEASQILEPQIMPLLTAMHGKDEAIAKFVFIGDHKQLPAVVSQPSSQSKVEEKELIDIGLTDCRNSFFERLLRTTSTYFLSHQGRMHVDIADFPNKTFYGSLLEPVPLPHQIAGGAHRLHFINVPRPLNSPSDKVNLAEAEVIAGIVAEVASKADRFDPERTIGVIVPYRNQILAIRKAIEKLNPMAARITIDTVERYQGSQRETIIYGFTVQRDYQLRFLTDSTFKDSDGTLIDRKLNVAMTRAMSNLYLVGNAELLQRVPIFRKLIEFLGGPRQS